MTWNYRVMRRELQNTSVVEYGIYEVYYSARTGKVDGWTESACTPQSVRGEESLQSLRLDFRMMAQAFKRPVLDYDTGKEYHAQTAQAKKAQLRDMQASQDGLVSALEKRRRAKSA